jgi:hypothetical protein
MHTKFFTLAFLLFSTFACLQSAEEQKRYDYTLTVCAIFNNDAPWLKEWIEYHKLLGVDHFLLYNNESTDNYLEVLSPYILSEQVALIDWPNRPADNEICAWVHATQQPAYNDALKRMRGRTQWLALIDTDEFILPLTCDSMRTFLRKYEHYAALAINWVSYGTSYCKTIPPDKLMIECLTLRAPYLNPHFMGEKSIVQPERVDSCNNPHIFTLKANENTVDSNGNPYIKGSTTNFDQIVINHYFTRTLDFLYNEKIPRKFKMDNVPISEERLSIILREANLEEELTINKYVPALRKKIGLDN